MMPEVGTYGGVHLGEYVDTSARAVVHREPTRRRWAVEEKRRIVEQTLAAGGSVARVARAHGVPPRVAGFGEHRGGEFASGSCDGSVGRGSRAIERRAETPNRVGNDPGGTAQGTSSNHRQHR